MRYRSRILVVALVLCAGAGLAAQWPPPAESVENKLVQHARNNPGNPAAGARFFDGNSLSCVSCHGQPGNGGGNGGKVPDLKGVGTRHNREQLMRKVLSPRPGAGMPQGLAHHFQQPDDFANLIAYLERLR